MHLTVTYFVCIAHIQYIAIHNNPKEIFYRLFLGIRSLWTPPKVRSPLARVIIYSCEEPVTVSQMTNNT